MVLYPHNFFKLTTLFNAVLQYFVHLGTGVGVNSVEDMLHYNNSESGENNPKQVIRYFFIYLLCFSILFFFFFWHGPWLFVDLYSPIPLLLRIHNSVTAFTYKVLLFFFPSKVLLILFSIFFSCPFVSISRLEAAPKSAINSAVGARKSATISSFAP